MNFAIIGINVVIYLATDLFGGAQNGGSGEEWKRKFLLDPAALKLWQFFTYQFLHGDLFHILGNMWFLWIFGNSVNSKMGNVCYLLFYLAAGVFAGVGFALSSQNPCLGASGAIAGVTTAFLVLFPHCEIKIFYWFFLFLGTFHLRATIMIVIKIILWDNILSPSLAQGNYSGVAYEAHLAGYLFGFVLCFALLLVHALPRDQYDILAIVKRKIQRRQMAAAMADPDNQSRAIFGRVAAPVARLTGRPVARVAQPMDDETIQLRTRIAEAMSKDDFAAAADLYEELNARDPNQVLPRMTMLAIANQLKILGRYPQAAAAYEKHLKTYATDPDVARIKLMLGIIYAKYLQQNETAEPFLRESAESLTDPDQREQAAQWLETVLAAMGRGPSTA